MQFFWQLSRFIILFLINPKDFPCLHYGAPFWHLSMYTILTNSELWESYPTIWEILVGFLIKIKNTTWRVAVVITFFLLFFHLFLLVGGLSLYNIVVVFVIHLHESTMDIHVFPIPIPPPTSLSKPHHAAKKREKGREREKKENLALSQDQIPFSYHIPKRWMDMWKIYF